MKRHFILFMVLSMVIGLVGCVDRQKIETQADVVFLEYYDSSEDSEHLSLIQDGLDAFCTKNKLVCTTYRLTEEGQKNLQGSLDLAQKGGARIVIATPDFLDGILKLAGDFPELEFAIIDTSINDEDAAAMPANVSTFDFNFYELGYMVGTLAPYGNFTSVGLIDRSEDQRSMSYARGVLAGMGAASDTLKKSMTFHYLPAKNATSNAVNQMIYQSVVSEQDTLTYFGPNISGLIEQYTIKAGTRFIGCGSYNDGKAYFYGFADYDQLFESFYTQWQKDRGNGLHVLYGVKEGAVRIEISDAVVSDTLAAYNNMQASIQQGTWSAPDEGQELSAMTFEQITTDIKTDEND